jgi:hypothetical protein
VLVRSACLFRFGKKTPAFFVPNGIWLSQAQATKVFKERRVADTAATVAEQRDERSKFSEDVSAIDPTPGRQSLIYTEMLKKIDELELDRGSRLVAADNIRLAPTFWETIGLLLLVLLLLASFSETTFSLGGAMALGCQGFAVTLLVALVFMYDRPFKGKTSLSPQPVIKAIAEMQNRASTGH